MSSNEKPELILIKAGEQIEVKNKWGETSKTRINRVYEVRHDGEVIGYVKRSMLTRERRSPGLRYVHARWQSPGWQYGREKHGRMIECSSAKDGAERLVREKKWRKRG